MLKKMRIRLICLTGILSGLACFAIFGLYRGSFFTSNSLNDDSYKTASGIPSKTLSSHPDREEDSKFHGTAEKARENDIYFLSKKEYNDLISALSYLYIQAYSGALPSETGSTHTPGSLINGFILPDDLPPELLKEHAEALKLFSEMLKEKKYWDRYQQEKYKGVLESNLEPQIPDMNHLELADKENEKYFIELKSALWLQRRLIRDIRLFHAEVQFQEEQSTVQNEYQLYAMKYNLNPFARETGLADAMRQAMSALTAGVYQKEAVEVLDRLGTELTKPIHQIYEGQIETGEYPSPATFNYDLYIDLGRKLMKYADTLSKQSMIDLDPSTRTELDYFKRRLSHNLYDLYLIVKKENIKLTHLDLKELEQYITPR